MSDVVDSVDTGKSKFDKEGSSGEYPILGSTSVIGYDDEYDYEGDFILSARVGANAGSLYRHAGKVKISDNTVFIQASQNIEFLYQLLIRFDIKRLSFGTGQPLVKASELKRLELMMPTDMEEQIRIGVYFKNLDHLITLHQGKYLQEKKTSLTWEQRKLGDWGTFYYGKSCPKWSVTEDSTTPCIRYGELYTKFGAKIDRVYSYTNMSPENLRFSKGTEVLIPRVGEDPMDYNHCTWLSMPNVAIGEMISVFNTDNNPLFTAMMFNATLQNEFAMRVEGGSVTNLYFEKLKSIEVSFPSIPEQEKIAAYFDSIDHLITLHRRAHFHRRRRTYK